MMRFRRGIFGLLLPLCLAILTVWVARAHSGGGIENLIRHRIFLGGPLLEVHAPERGKVVPQGGIPVIVLFPERDRVIADTFRCLLNGHDVTAMLTVGENGAGGAVFPLLEGENLIRVGVFGPGREDGTFFEHVEEVSFQVRVAPYLDRAEGRPRRRA